MKKKMNNNEKLKDVIMKMIDARFVGTSEMIPAKYRVYEQVRAAMNECTRSFGIPTPTGSEMRTSEQFGAALLALSLTFEEAFAKAVESLRYTHMIGLSEPEKKAMKDAAADYLRAVGRA